MRGVDQVPQFVREEPEALAPARRLALDRELIPLAPVLGDGAGDGVVEAAVQRTKVFRADRGVHLDGQFGDRLTDVAIVVHDLRHREPLQQQVMAMQDRAPAYLRTRSGAPLQGVHQLIEEDRDPVIDLRRGRWRHRPRGHLPPASRDDFVAVGADELVEHRTRPVGSILCQS